MTEPLPLKRVADINAGQSPLSQCVSDAGNGLPFLQGNAEFGAMHPTARYACDAAPKRCREGDVLLSVRAPVGALNVADQPYGIGRGLCAVTPRKLIPRYLWWSMVASIPRLQSLATGSTYDAVSAEDVGGLVVRVPSLREQRATADYLDAETARIDGLIGRKQDLLDLLAARRASFVAALITGKPGASPRASLPWLAAVPSSWPSAPLGLLADVFNGSTPERQESDLGGIPWTTSGEIDRGVITTPTAYISDEVRRAHGLRVAPAGSTVVGLVGQGRTRGLSAQLAIPTTLNQNLAAICPRDDRLDSAYIGMLLGLAYDDLRNGGRGGNQAALNCEMIKAFRIPVAPRHEQSNLVDEVAVERTRDDAMASLLMRSIKLLHERRHALIATAVAGQLEIAGVAA